MGKKQSHKSHSYHRSHTHKSKSASIWTRILIIVGAILVAVIILAFTGVQPLSAYKDNAIATISIIIHPNNGTSTITALTTPFTDEIAVRNTINGYYASYNAMEFDKCLNYLSSNVVSKFGANDIVQSTSIHHNLTGGIDIQIKGITITSNIASVSIYETNKDSKMITSADIIDAPLIKEGSNWRLSWKAPGINVNN